MLPFFLWGQGHPPFPHGWLWRSSPPDSLRRGLSGITLAPAMPGPPPLVFPRIPEDDDPVLSDGEVLPVQWTPEVIVAMDWKKLVELARAVAASAGCEPGATKISLDGSAEFELMRGQGFGSWRERIRLAPWNRWMATGECLNQFARSLSASPGKIRGVYLAPGGGSPSAAIEASRHRIDLVDAAGLAETLNGLPQAHSEYFHDVAMSGQPFVPSCPACLRLLNRVADHLQDEKGFLDLQNNTYGTSDIVAEPVVARMVEVLRNCEVHFLREVRARDLIVNGTVHGDFVCEGCVILNPGAVLHGTVAARSVLVRPGAALHGETRILAGDLGSVEKPGSGWLWRCGSLPPGENCEIVSFLPH